MAKPKRIFDHPIDSGHVRVDVAIWCCFDPWFMNPMGYHEHSTLDAFIRAQKKTVVFLTEPGGIKTLASQYHSDAAEKESMLRRTASELLLHHPSEICLTVHRDCGGYGYSGAFADSEQEIQRLCQDLLQARQLFEEHFENQAAGIRLFIFDFEGITEVFA